MGNALEFILKLTDMLTPGMRQAARITETSASQIAQQFENINRGGKRMAASVDELRRRLDAINRVRFSTSVTKEFDIATKAAQRLERQINRMENRGKSGSFGMIGGLLGGLGIGAGIGSAIKLSAAAEMSKASYSTLLGSKEKGAAMYKDLNKFGNETVFQNQDVYRNANTLLAFGIAGEKIMPTMRMLGDVSMGNKDRMDALSLAYAQTQTAGKLMGQDLLQYVNAGFNPLNEISKITGIKLEELRKKMEAGAISSEMVTAAFQHATSAGGMFHNALKNSADTVTGKWGIFMGSVQTKLIALGDLLKPLVKTVLDFGSALLENTPALAMIAAGIGLVTLATGGWSAAQAVLNFVLNMNPIIRIISLILILGGIIWGVIKRFDGWGTSLISLWEIAKSVAGLLATGFKLAFQDIVYWGEYAWLKLKGIFIEIKEWFSDVFKSPTEILQREIQRKATGYKNAAEVELEKLKQDHSVTKLNYQQQMLDYTDRISKSWKSVGLTTTNTTVVDPTTATLGTTPGISKAAFKSLGDGGKSKAGADGVNAGGQRSIVINIGKQIEKLEVHVMNAKEGAQEIESAVRESLRRVLYSMNGVVS